MNPSKHDLWIEDGDLFRCDVSRCDLAEFDVKRDPIRNGYWIDPNSKTATILALKGVRFHKPKVRASLSSVLGTKFI